MSQPARSEKRGTHRKAFDDFKREALAHAADLKEGKPAALYVMIADECHWGPTMEGAHDTYVNDPELMAAPNLLLLLVSATPYNTLTSSSRVIQTPGESNVVRWFADSTEKAETEYRSMQFYLDTIAFEVPLDRREAKLTYQFGHEQARTLSLSLEGDGGAEASSYANVQGQPLRFGELKAVADVLTASLEKQIGRAKQLVVRHNIESGRFELHRPNALKLKVTRIKLEFGERSIWPLLGFTEAPEQTLAQGSDSLIAANDVTIDEKCPTELQRIRADGDFAQLCVEFKKRFGKRKGRTCKCGTMDDKEFAIQDGHILICEYLVSLVYFAVFRVNERWREDGAAILISNEETEARLADATLFGSDPARGFRSRLDTACRKTTGHLTYDLAEVVDMICKLDMKDAREALEAIGTLAPDDTALYQYWMREKFKGEKDALTTTEKLSWFNETDRIIKSLLDQSPRDGCAHGRMVILRVYENDENLSMQKMMRTALDLIGLGGDVKRAFSVVSDIGKTILFSHIERCFLDYDLRRPMHLQSGGPCEKVNAKGVPVDHFSLRSIFDKRVKDAKLKDAQLRYEDLYNLPCVIILCDKGRMGDTFPHSLETLDFRLRTAGVYSAFLQELGRMCRYPATRPVSFNGLMSNEANVADIELDLQNEEWRSACSIRRGYAFELPLLVRRADNGSFVGIACNEAQLKETLTKLKETGAGSYRLEIYLDRLPRALVLKKIHERLIDAVNRKYAQAPNNDNITAAECILMPQPGGLDLYMQYRQDQGVTESNLISQINDVALVNPLHDYHANYEPSLRGDRDGTSVQKPHYDFVAKDSIQPHQVHERRIVLFAECQIGKTGAYLHLISSLREEVQAGHHAIEIARPITTRTWNFPCTRMPALPCGRTCTCIPPESFTPRAVTVSQTGKT